MASSENTNTAGDDARRPARTLSTEAQATVATLLDAQRRISDAVLVAVQRRHRVRFAIVGGLLVAALCVLAFVARHDARRIEASTRALDSLATIEHQQRTELVVAQHVRDSLTQLAHASAAQLLATADSIDKTEHRAPLPRITVQRLGTMAGRAGATEGGGPSSVAQAGTAPGAAAPTYPIIDSSWYAVTFTDSADAATDSAPHYVDSVTASTLARLDTVARSFDAFRATTRVTLTQALTALDSANAVSVKLTALNATLVAERDTTRALIPTRAQRLWHDAKLVAPFVAYIVLRR